MNNKEQRYLLNRSEMLRVMVMAKEMGNLRKYLECQLLMQIGDEYYGYVPRYLSDNKCYHWG